MFTLHCASEGGVGVGLDPAPPQGRFTLELEAPAANRHPGWDVQEGSTGDDPRERPAAGGGGQKKTGLKPKLRADFRKGTTVPA
jgi:hypothetical protein